MHYTLDEKLTLELGGVPQAVRFRSTDESLPVLLFLHGGPGVCDRHWVLRDQSALSEIATMVCWDQRGAGLSWLMVTMLCLASACVGATARTRQSVSSIM